MQFKVPQFLDIEDKIFGPFTFKEFVYLVGGLGMCYILYRLLGVVIGALPIFAVGGFSAMLIFYRPNSKPFINMIEAGFRYLTQSKLYIWKRRKHKKEEAASKENDKKKAVPNNYSTKLSGDRLRDLAWSLDVLDLNQHRDINIQK